MRLGLILLFLLLAATGGLAQNHPIPFLNQPLSPLSAAPSSGVDREETYAPFFGFF